MVGPAVEVFSTFHADWPKIGHSVWADLLGSLAAAQSLRLLSLCWEGGDVPLCKKELKYVYTSDKPA